MLDYCINRDRELTNNECLAQAATNMAPSGPRRKPPVKKPEKTLISFPTSIDEAINDYFADMAGLFVTFLFLAYFINWGLSFLFEPFIILTSNVTDGTEDNNQFLYGSKLPNDIQFVFWWGIFLLVMMDISKDIFYNRITKKANVVKELQPSFMAHLNHLVSQLCFIAAAKTVITTNPGFAFPIEPTDFNLTVFVAMEVAYWIQVPISAFYIFKVRKSEFRLWMTRSMVKFIALFMLYEFGCRKLVMFVMVFDHLREALGTASILADLSAKQKTDEAVKKSALGSNGKRLAEINALAQPGIRMFCLILAVAVPLLAIKNGEPSAPQWLLTSAALVAHQISGAIF